MKENLMFVGLVAAGVTLAAVGISWARGANLPLITDIARLAHDGFDGAGS